MLRNIKSLHLKNNKFLCILVGLFCIISVFFLVKIIQPKQTYQFEGERMFVPGNESGAVYTGISLSPGIYHVEMNMEADRDKIAVCTIEDGTVFSGGLLTNGEHLYAGMTRTDYDFWLFESTENLQVIIEYGGEGTLICGDLTITDTGRLWSMLWVICAFLMACIAMLVIFFCYDKHFPMPASKKQVIFFLFIIILIASIPYLCGYNISGADLTYHLQRIEGVKDGLKSGYFPVRLESEWLYGYGYADGIFYCNALFYFPALLRLAGFPVSFCYNVYCIALNIATVCIAWYCFSKVFRDEIIGVICSGLYTLSIFRITRLVIVTAVGDGSAFTFIPLVLYGFYRMFTEDICEKKYKSVWVPIAVGFSGLIQTHVLTCEITVFFTLILFIFFIKKLFRLPTLLELAKGALAALGLSLWYIVPFLDYYLTQDVHIKHVSARTIQERGSYLKFLIFNFIDYDNLSVLQSDIENPAPPGIAFILVIGLFLFLVLWFSGNLRKEMETNLYFVKIIAVIAILFLWMSLVYFPWNYIQGINSVLAFLVSSLQIPYRLLGWATICLIMVFGYCLCFFRERKLIFSCMTYATIIGIACSGFYLFNYTNCSGQSFQLYNEESMGFGYISGAEYLIEGTDNSLLTFEKKPKTGQDIVISSYQRGHLCADLSCENTGSEESYVDVPLLLYKGYRAYGNGEELAIGYGENNVVRVYIPPSFSGAVEVRFQSPFYWRISEVASLLVLVGIVVWAVMGRRRYRKCEE